MEENETLLSNQNIINSKIQDKLNKIGSENEKLQNKLNNTENEKESLD
jgi:hypothetical protein